MAEIIPNYRWAEARQEALKDISLADVKIGVFGRDVPMFERSW